MFVYMICPVPLPVNRFVKKKETRTYPQSLLQICARLSCFFNHLCRKQRGKHPQTPDLLDHLRIFPGTFTDYGESCTLL